MRSPYEKAIQMQNLLKGRVGLPREPILIPLCRYLVHPSIVLAFPGNSYKAKSLHAYTYNHVSTSIIIYLFLPCLLRVHVPIFIEIVSHSHECYIGQKPGMAFALPRITPLRLCKGFSNLHPIGGG